ncbi:MAG: PQQ-binding-like beta-propeller repeat protein [Planctomycetes bacterium]|nr:PQQ-binding-like beta-propeller repeat protein [Planctomycetota bacterium]
MATPPSDNPSARRGPRAQTALCALACLLGLAGGAGAQIRPGVRAPVAVQGALTEPDHDPGADPGRPVQLLESPNIDRFLRRAQDFLGREDYPTAVGLLQDVIEGRTLEDPAAVPPETSAGTPPEPGGPDEGGAPTAADAWAEDARHAVFSEDQRLYRPVERLCHELLAALPTAGLAYYRAAFEVAAERALDAALRTGDVAALHEVHQRWFATVAAGRAMLAAGDAELDRGSLRQAVRTFRDLLEIYPRELWADARVEPTWVHFKIALAFHLLGDDEQARGELRSAIAADPDATLRVAGELVSLARLAEGGFAATPPPEPVAAGTAAAIVLDVAHGTLVPLWEFRFADPRPYRPARVSGNTQQRFAVVQGDGLAPTPKYSDYVTGPVVTRLPGGVAFVEHRCLRAVDALTGRSLAANEGEVAIPDPQPGQPRQRIPAYDFGALRAVPTGTGDVCILVPQSQRPEGMRAVLVNGLELWSRDGTQCRWRTRENVEFADTTFLAAPTSFGTRLLVPTLNRGTIELSCLEAADGSVIYRVPLHRGGTDLARPPTVPVRIDDGIAYVLTNAGCLAAVAVHTGALRWIRRYERTHPYRPEPPRTRQSARDMFGGAVFQEERLPGFAPSDLIVRDGLVVFAPTDGGTLIALDAISGQPVWMLSRNEMVVPIGHDGEDLFVLGRDELYCIGLTTGLRKWRVEVPPHAGSARWRGRGTVVGERVLVPGERRIHVMPTTGGDWTSVDLPEFRLGAEPLQGPMDLFADGPFLFACFEGGIEAYSTIEALELCAAGESDPVDTSAWLAQAGDLLGAVAALEQVEVPPPDVQERMLSLCSELALAMASHGERDRALELLERARARLDDRELVLRWHLARVEVFETLGDPDGVYVEQRALYDAMEHGSERPTGTKEDER